ncbi:hypothetical protein K432DRAFT_90954 [Lepidopterella palustris CBS 459.81]|uniref:Uncharacterized protein n=1 Tax=Lepidopterella palustris CBS 459.81 TaxID=1314670 RepID=A0A8E2JJN5_9PEZI|nr:hypothetical protein K432DRAFT_90954 [Lepidopterella palustris CBS 459.81]
MRIHECMERAGGKPANSLSPCIREENKRTREQEKKKKKRKKEKRKENASPVNTHSNPSVRRNPSLCIAQSIPLYGTIHPSGMAQSIPLYGTIHPFVWHNPSLCMAQSLLSKWPKKTLSFEKHAIQAYAALLETEGKNQYSLGKMSQLDYIIIFQQNYLAIIFSPIDSCTQHT